MKLWLLEAKDKHKLWEPWYDKMFSIVVRAESVGRARIIASKNCGDESPLAWLNSDCSTCQELKSDGKEEPIVINFASA